MTSIPLVDAPALRPLARRTFAVRTALLLAATAAAVAFLLVSRSPHTRTIVPIAAGANTIVVIDLSASINYCGSGPAPPRLSSSCPTGPTRRSRPGRLRRISSLSSATSARCARPAPE